MTDREKLIELFEAVPHPKRLYPDLFVDDLIANGVTIHRDRYLYKQNGEIVPLTNCQQWIPVSNILPQDGDRVLAYYQDGMVRIIAVDGGFPMVLSNELKWVRATHWMPMPQPPNS